MKLPTMAKTNAGTLWKTMTWATCEGDVPVTKGVTVNFALEHEDLVEERVHGRCGWTLSMCQGGNTSGDTPLAKWAGEEERRVEEGLDTRGGDESSWERTKWWLLP